MQAKREAKQRALLAQQEAAGEAGVSEEGESAKQNKREKKRKRRKVIIIKLGAHRRGITVCNHVGWQIALQLSQVLHRDLL